MDLRQIRYFIAVAEESNFGLAARRLNISQPPITRQIRKLEEELGVTLLKRTSKGAELTPPGVVFLEDVRRVMAQTTRAAERVKAAQKGEIGRLEIGYFGSVIYSAVPQLLMKFRESNPDVEVGLHRLSKKEQVYALKIGQIHIGFGRYYQKEPGYAVESVVPETLAVAVPISHGKNLKTGTSFDLFKNFPVILFPKSGRPNFADEIIKILKEKGIEPAIAAETEDVRSALTLASLAVGATVVPATVAELNWPGIKFFPLEPVQNNCEVCCLYRRSDTSPLLRSLLSTIRSNS